jgi:hypothetical protein
MYVFTCPNDHKSYSASKEQYHSECPECGEPTKLVGDESQESDISPEANVWFPGPDALYKGREGVYARLVMEFSEAQIVALVQGRAEEDGEWVIEHGLMDGHEELMRKMMAWVSRETNIRQALSHLTLDNGGHSRRAFVAEEYIEPTNEQLAKFLSVYAKQTPGLEQFRVNPAILESMMALQPEYREAALRLHRQFQTQINNHTLLMKAGKLQCEHFRPNGKRCPNRNEPGSLYCGLHKEEHEDSE